MDPTVAALLAENTLVVQSGIRYCEYVKIRCKDGIELTQNSRLMNYHYKVDNNFCNYIYDFIRHLVQYICYYNQWILLDLRRKAHAS